MRKTMFAEMNFNKTSAQSEMERNSSLGESGKEIYCICRSSNINTFMISCDNCQEWFHGDCVGVNENSAKNIDLYFCKSCQEINSNLKTTYKSKRRSIRKLRKPIKRRKTQKSEILEEITIISKANSYSFLHTNIQNKVTSKECKTNEEETKLMNKNEIRLNDKNQIINDAELASIFEMDTTRRKAKTIANENLKQQQIEKCEDKVQKKKKQAPPRQCYGPECVKASRDNSKYCSDECGIRLNKNRILEIIPNRIHQRKILTCAADESSRRKLAAVRQQQKIIYKSLEQIDTKISQLLQLVKKSRSSREDMVFLDDFEEEHSTLDCKLCGAEIPSRIIVKHLESCYKKQERRLMLTGIATKLDEEWDIFCNQKMGRQGFCKQLRVLCPFHIKDSRDEDDHCGYPLQMNLSLCEGKFCGRSIKNCSRHPSSWEDIFRAEFDMEKLKLLLELNELEREEVQLRREMAARGNLVALMLHSTIVH